MKKVAYIFMAIFFVYHLATYGFEDGLPYSIKVHIYIQGVLLGLIVIPTIYILLDNKEMK